MTNIMDPCVGKILSFLVEPVSTHGAYVIQYKNHVQQLEDENKKLGEKKKRIQGMVDEATNKGEVIETDVSSWLEKVGQMEGDIANFLHQQEDGESFRCFPGCMCPNLMWRHKRGMQADKSKLEVSELISKGELLQTSRVARNESFQSELHFDSSQYNYTTFQSRSSVVQEIKNALNGSGVDVIGVHGPGGVGKTTMVTEVAKEAKKLGIFDKFAIAVVSKDPNTSILQEELASQLDFKYEQKSEIGRADELRKALLNGKRKILVILDDLWQVLGLNAIGIPTSGQGDRGCKILLTSRDEEIFRRMGVHSRFRIGYLEEQETWRLFTKVIAGDFRVDESIARKVSQRCGGLPIAIVAVGAALMGKEEAEWQNALHQLENCPLKYIEGSEPVGYTPLRLSYDFLKDKDAKSCFLLCCLFPEDAEISIDDLVRYSFALGFLRKVYTLKDAGNRVQAMVNKLTGSCLLLSGKNKNFVKMHDVIRGLAISITGEKQIKQGGGLDWPGQQQFIVDHDIKEWPKNDAWEHQTAISLRINNYNIHCPLMHTLVLKRGEFSCEIPNDFFQGMKGARVLDFKNIVFRLPSSVLELDDLRMLRLNNCQLQGDWSTIQNLKNHIEILSLKGSKIHMLPQEIGQLTRLRSLDLRGCQFLKVIPKGVISNLINLEELYVIGRFTKWDTTIDGEKMSNASIAELKSLNQLTVLYVGISTRSYRIMGQECCRLFGKLIKFYIYINDSDHFGFGSLNALTIFNIRDIKDEFHLLMDRVEQLTLWHIRDMRYLQFTPSGGRYFSKLIDLDIFGCHSMKYLFSPSCAKALQQLKRLRVSNCGIMELIIGVVGDHCDETIIFNRLERIELSVLPEFRSFCANVCPKLRDLHLHSLNDEDYWSYDNSVILYLKSISIRHCDSLRHVFSAFVAKQLACIEELRVEACSGMEVIVLDARGEGVTDDAIIEFSQLETLELLNLPNLKSFFQSKFEASHLFNYQVTFPKINYLYLKNLKSSREIQFWNLLLTTQGHLHKVKIFGCQVSTKVTSHYGKRNYRMTINKLILRNCHGFKHVIDLNGTISIGEEKFVDMKMLELRHLHELVLLWNMNLQEIEGFRSLKRIVISCCSQLRSLFMYSMATTLQHLEMLSLEYCRMMEEIIIIEENNDNFAGEEKATLCIEFPKLQWLVLKSLPNLKSFCEDERTSFNFSSLSSIIVEDCPEMKIFASGQICLPPGMIEVEVGEEEEVEITDLNAFFESRNKGNNYVEITINWGDESVSELDFSSESDSDADISSESDSDADIAI